MSRDRAAWRPTFILLTCEHGGREVPAEYRQCFAGASDVLRSHRGYDIGALGVAHRLADRLAAPIIFSTTTRLLIELNRSRDHVLLFSEFTRDLPPEAKERIVSNFYAPYRAAVQNTIDAAVRSDHRVLHVGVHSFTDVLDGQRRDLEIALLFDPDRPHELSFCQRWREELNRRNGDFRYRFNEPYLGKDDGLTTSMRCRFPADRFLGIEIEVRQSLIREPSRRHPIGDLLTDSLAAAAAR